MSLTEVEDMSATEFARWVAYNSLQPFGEFREDYRAAMIATTVAQVFAGKGKRYRIKDFMPDFDKESVIVDDTELEAKTIAWVRSVGGIVIDGKPDSR